MMDCYEKLCNFGMSGSESGSREIRRLPIVLTDKIWQDGLMGLLW